MSDAQTLLAEYRELWRVFLDTPDKRGPDVPPRQVCFDIDRVERQLKAAGVADPFELVRIRIHPAEITAEPAPTTEPPRTASNPQPAQLALF